MRVREDMQSFRELLWGGGTRFPYDDNPMRRGAHGVSAFGLAAAAGDVGRSRKETPIVSWRGRAAMAGRPPAGLTEIDKSVAASINSTPNHLMNTTTPSRPGPGQRRSQVPSRRPGFFACGAAIPEPAKEANGGKQCASRPSREDAAQQPAAASAKDRVGSRRPGPMDGSCDTLGTIIADVGYDGRGDDTPSLATAGIRPEQQVHREGQ